MATKTRSRKRKVSDTSTPTPESDTGSLAPATPQRVEPADDKNVSPFEGTLSVYGGVLLIVAALFPRTFKQLLLLGLGASFLYRGQSRHCHMYSALGIDTNKEGLIKQVNGKLVS